MKITVWTLASAVPEGSIVEPALVETFATEAEARARFDECMRGEWSAHEPWGENDEPLEYPGDPDKAHEILRADREESDGEPWGAYEITSHTLTLPVAGAVALLRELVAYQEEQFDGDADVDLDVSGADTVDWLAEFRLRAKDVLVGAPVETSEPECSQDVDRLKHDRCPVCGVRSSEPCGDPNAAWSTTDAAMAEAEGWNIFNGTEIQRDDEAGTFASDEAVIQHVRARAAAGSATHKRALALHEAREEEEGE